MSFDYTAAFKIVGLNIQVLKADDTWIIVEGEKITRVAPHEAALRAYWPKYGANSASYGLYIFEGGSYAYVIDGAICYFVRADGYGECKPRSEVPNGTHASWCASTAHHCRKLAATPNYAGPLIQKLVDGEWATTKYMVADSDGKRKQTCELWEWEDLNTIPMYLPRDVQFPVTIYVEDKPVEIPTKYHASRTGAMYHNSAKFAAEHGIKFKPGSSSDRAMAMYYATVELNKKIHARIGALVGGALNLGDITITLDINDRATMAAMLFKQLKEARGVVYDTDVE